MNHEWYTREQAAQLLQVDPMTIYRWIKSGKLAASQPVPRGSYRIAASAIEQMMTSKPAKTIQQGE